MKTVGDVFHHSWGILLNVVPLVVVDTERALLNYGLQYDKPERVDIPRWSYETFG